MENITHIWDQYEDYEDELLSKGGGGSGGGKKKYVDPSSETAKSIRKDEIANRTEKEMDGVKARILKFTESFPKFGNKMEEDEFFVKYVNWINTYKTSSHEAVPWEENQRDVSYEFTRSGGAGGQNVNKVNSAVIITHHNTNLKIRNQETRDQIKNKANAQKIMIKRLHQHLDDWQSYCENQDVDQVDVENVIDILAEK